MGDDPDDDSADTTGSIIDQVGGADAVPKNTTAANIVHSGIVCDTHPGGTNLIATPELCDNDFDDDQDGLVDCEDAACFGVEPRSGPFDLASPATLFASDDCRELNFRSWV